MGSMEIVEPILLTLYWGNVSECVVKNLACYHYKKEVFYVVCRSCIIYNVYNYKKK